MEFAGSSRKRHSKKQKQEARRSSHRRSCSSRKPQCSSKKKKKKKSDRPRYMYFKQFKDAKTGKPVFKFSKPTSAEIKKILARAEMCKPRTWKYLRKQAPPARGRRRANSMTEPPKSRSTRNRSRRRSVSPRARSQRSKSIRSSRRKSIQEGEGDYVGQKQYMSNKSQSELRSEFDEEERLHESVVDQDFCPGGEELEAKEDELMQKEAELRRREQEQEEFMAQRDKYMDELEEEQKDVADERERVTQMSLEVVSAREQMMEHLASEKDKLRSMRNGDMPEEGRDELNMDSLNRIAEDSPEVDQEPVVANGDELREEVVDSRLRTDDYGTSPVDMNDPQADSPSKYMADAAASGLGSLSQRPYDSPTGMERETQHTNERFDSNHEQSEPQPRYDDSPADIARETQHTNERFAGGHEDYDVVAQLRQKHQELSGINEKIDVEEDDLRKKREEYESLAIELQKEEDKLRLLKEAVEDKVRSLDAILDKDASHQPSRPSAPSPEERLRLRGAGGSADELRSGTRYVE